MGVRTEPKVFFFLLRSRARFRIEKKDNKKLGKREKARPLFYHSLSAPHILITLFAFSLSLSPLSLCARTDLCTLRLLKSRKKKKHNKTKHQLLQKKKNMADNTTSEDHQSNKPPPGHSLAAPPPAEAPAVPFTAEQERAYRNRSSGSWFDASPAAAAPSYGGGRRGGGRGGGGRGGGKDRGGLGFPPPMHFPPPPPAAATAPQEQQQQQQ